MPEKLRNRLSAFMESDKDVPLLAGFAVGFYMMLFYYSRNFSLANSFQQLSFFTGYYLLLPALSLWAGFKVMPLIKAARWRKHFLFTGTVGFLSFFLIQVSTLGHLKKIIFLAIIFVAALLSLKISRYYKALIPILFLISAFNVVPLMEVIYVSMRSSDEWEVIHDDIENIKFKEKPNVYYIQPDGYTSFSNLKNSIHRFDNSDYESFLGQHGFTLYDNYRSNYFSTLLSNSATFAMKHHNIAGDVEMYRARSIIIEDNPVLRIFKKNGYRTSFITERPYLIINRPDIGYDYCNIAESELPLIKDGLDVTKDVLADLKIRMIKNGQTDNFYFIESFTPGHIAHMKTYSKGIEEEKNMYLEKIRSANKWLKEVITYIEANDPKAMIIIGADHGGFAGFNSTADSKTKTMDDKLIYSVFGAQLAIKWNSSESKQYDGELKTGINLFRTVFSFMGRDKKYLVHKEDDGSYIQLDTPEGIYKYINDDGKIVFQKQ